MADELIVNKIDQVYEITINRPAQRNALNKNVRDGLFAALRDAQNDERCRVVIITGAGDKAFSAGADLKEMADLGLRVPPPDFTPRIGRNIKLDKPLIAAVNGAAYAGGFLLAQMADLCVASTNATFCISEARWGRGAPWAVPLTTMLPRRIITELLILADPISAQRAYEVGLVNAVVEPDELMPRARAMARRICENAPLTVSGHLRMMEFAYELGELSGEKLADEIFEAVYSSRDAQEGPAAFREKRRPVWTGR